MKILFIKVGGIMCDDEKNKIHTAIVDLYTNYFNLDAMAIQRTDMSFCGKPIFETSDFPQGRLSFLSGQTMMSIIDKVDTKDIAPIVVFIVDPQPQLTMVNLCYKLLNKYGIVYCSVISDGAMEHYIVHEVVHAAHEFLLRKGIGLPDTQDDDIMKAGYPDSTTPEHQAIVKQNAKDLIPYLNKVSWELPKFNLMISLMLMVIKLLSVLVEKLKGNNLQVYAKEQAIKYGIDYRVLMATIEAESCWDPKAIGLNTNGSKDYGIVQINDFWHIGSNSKAAQAGEYYFPSSDYVLNNPKACIDWMIKQWVKGRQNDWCSYRNETYKLFLKNY